MKTNFKTNGNRIQETILKSFIAIAIFILSVSVSGQNFWASSDGNYFNLVQLVAASDKSETETLRTTVFAASIEKENEELLEVEDWMTSENHFGMFVEIENEMDESLELEEWMINEANFTFGASETDAPLELESWMINEGHFISDYEPAIIEEEPLKLEGWMTNANNFRTWLETDEPLKLEAWMVAANYFE